MDRGPWTDSVLSRAACLAAAFTCIAATASAQPMLANGTIEPHVVTRGLDQEIRTLAAKQNEPAWIGYAVPAQNGERSMCCWSGDGSGAGRTGCRLEPGAATAVTMSTPSSQNRPFAERSVPLESGDSFFVLYRIEQGQVSRIRMFSDDCPLDAGGRSVHWLSPVRPAESVAFLSTFLSPMEGGTRQLKEGGTLVPPTSTARAMLSIPRSSEMNKIANSTLSALAMHRDPGALERLLAAARDGATTNVRGQALFWLAQRAGDKAVGAISAAIAGDPETEVKRRAVFALSQLPKDQGVPLLIQVAQTNTNPSVRKQAIFWLGQSKDPRALRFFENILFRKP